MARILLVDDSAAVRRLVGARLAADDHEVEEVESGEVAIERALREPFDLVVSDVRMGAITGVQLCRVLRSDPATVDLPIVLLSASDDPRSRFWGRNAGADAYVAKEAMLEVLAPTVTKLLERRTARPTGPPRLAVIDAAARVSAVMDQHLFEALVAREAHTLMAHLEDRHAFVSAAIELVGDVVSAACASLVVLGVEGPTSAVVAHGAFPASPGTITWAALGLPDASLPPVLFRDAEPASTSELSPDPTERFDVVVGGEVIATLRLYGGGKRISRDDRRTADVLVESLAPIVKSILLLEETRELARRDAITRRSERPR